MSVAAKTDPAPNAEMAVASAKTTLQTEAAGLSALSDALSGPLGSRFAEAVAAMRDLEGRVVVTGMGKSGNVGQKIASTLASTGTPAFFIHPSDASHGDLGMVTRHDLVLALSWSGETSELRALIDYTRRFRVPLVAMTSRPESALASAADIILQLPQ
ncbi:MAG: SIS domain-containing protein, partial [Rhodobiaceae bacterium]|nr:SIS domain-containing protein [Rhodobiaceae bacterium]